MNPARSENSGKDHASKTSARWIASKSEQLDKLKLHTQFDEGRKQEGSNRPGISQILRPPKRLKMSRLKGETCL